MRSLQMICQPLCTAHITLFAEAYENSVVRQQTPGKIRRTTWST